MITSPYKKVSKLEWYLVAIISVAAALSFFPLFSRGATDGLLHVYSLNIGQGDAEFIQAPNGNQILIDGGPDGTILQRLGQVMPLNDRSIDMIVLSHPHADHVNGLIEVLKNYQVDTIIENDIPYDSPEHDMWNRLKTRAHVLQARTGQVFDLGGGATLNVLYPYQSGTHENHVKNPHDFMVVTRLDYGDESVMLTGDMEAKLEDRLIRNDTDLSAQFLKIGHHGSKTSTTNGLLDAVQPILAFMSLGARNRYGHPHATVIDRLEKHGIRYYRTDRDGSSDLQLDGRRYKVVNF